MIENGNSFAGRRAKIEPPSNPSYTKGIDVQQVNVSGDILKQNRLSLT